MCDSELKLLFSCENAQEYRDINLLMQELVKESGAEVTYFNLTSTTGIPTKDGSDSGWFAAEFTAVRIFKKKLRELSPFSRLIASFVIALQLVLVCKTRKIDRVVVGVPLLPYRIARILSFGTIHYISIIRGIIVKSDRNTSLSSRMFLRLKWLGNISLFRKLISDYYADTVICTGRVTKDFLISRHVPSENIKTIGSVYCDTRLGRNERNINTQKIKTVVFISSAFEWHGNNAAQQAQTRLIRRINELITHFANDRRCDFIIRKHPRESLDTYSHENDLSALLDDTCDDPLISYPSGSLFISPVSTLIFELSYLGRLALIAGDDFFANHLREWYKAVGVEPITDIEKLINNYIFCDLDLHQNSYDDVISLDYKHQVVNEYINVIKACNN